MEKKEVVLQCPKEITEVGEALGAILKAVDVALKDGFQPGTDIPLIVTAAISHLGKAIEGAGSIPADFVADPVNSIFGALVPVADGIKELIKKD